MEKTLTKKEKIKSLWKQLNNNGEKSDFINECAEKFNRSAKTIRQWWFSKYGDWSVPVEFQDEVIIDLKKSTKEPC